MCSENGLVERNQAKHPLSHIHLETLTFPVQIWTLIWMTFSNLNDSMINTINAVSVHLLGEKQISTGYSGLHSTFHVLFLSAVKWKTAIITFAANTLLTHDTGKMQRIRNAFPGCSGNSKTWEYEKVLPSFVQNLTRVLRCVYHFLWFSSFPLSHT